MAKIALAMRIISLFSGIGGLEHSLHSPILACEMDQAAQKVLRARFPRTPIEPDVLALGKVDDAELVLGGWPCQDLSVAGKQAGLAGNRSRLFYEMLRIAKASAAETLIAENVPNLLRLSKGAEMREVIRAIHEAGFQHVSWRILNAREFGLPHQRRRVFIVASKRLGAAESLHRPIPKSLTQPHDLPFESAGFYWTAGTHGICYSSGFVPTLKVGSGLSIPSPIAIHHESGVRRLSPSEAFRLQGFDPALNELVRKGDAFRLAGNAVARPVGEFVVASQSAELDSELSYGSFGTITDAGISSNGQIRGVSHLPVELARNLHQFLDASDPADPLGRRAASGLLRRLRRSDKPCPDRLWEDLCAEAGEPLVFRSDTARRTSDFQRHLTVAPEQEAFKFG